MVDYPKMRSVTDWRRANEADRKKQPLKCFLDKTNRTYPYMLWSASKGDYVPSQRMLKSAIALANLHGRKNISSRAQRILDRLRGGK